MALLTRRAFATIQLINVLFGPRIRKYRTCSSFDTVCVCMRVLLFPISLSQVLSLLPEFDLFRRTSKRITAFRERVGCRRKFSVDKFRLSIILPERFPSFANQLVTPSNPYYESI